MVDARTAREAVEEVYRREHERIFAGLVRTLRDFDRAEDALAEALAEAMARGPERGLELIRPLEESGELGDYFLLHSAVGDLERRLGREPEASAAYRRALALAPGPSDERFLRRRLSELGA